MHTEALTEDSATIALIQHDPARQRITKQHVTLDTKGIRPLPVAMRYAWPAELDLMARLAGLQLRERYADWRRRPFDADSRGHVSVYQRG